jgi:pyrroline-5-carboxylate reductase
MAHELLPRLGFIGGGKMAAALIRGLQSVGLTSPDRVIASDVLLAARESLAKDTGIAVTADNREVVARSEVLVLAVKPQVMANVLEEIQSLVTPDHLVVSIAAGIRLGQLSDWLGVQRRIVRVMPNTPCLVGACAAGYAMGAHVRPGDGDIVARMFNAVGKAFLLPEHLLDAVTGLSGSGPAYVAVMIEALTDGGVRMGLPRDAALTLAAQTVFGAAKMILEAGLHPAVLKDMVASPGGTTLAGLHALERGGVRAALMDTVEAATQRAMELGNRD